MSCVYFQTCLNVSDAENLHHQPFSSRHFSRHPCTSSPPSAVSRQHPRSWGHVGVAILLTWLPSMAGPILHTTAVPGCKNFPNIITCIEIIELMEKSIAWDYYLPKHYIAEYMLNSVHQWNYVSQNSGCDNIHLYSTFAMVILVVSTFFKI